MFKIRRDPARTNKMVWRETPPGHISIIKYCVPAKTMINSEKIVKIYAIAIAVLIILSVFQLFIMFLSNQTKEKAQYQSCVDEAHKNQYELYQRLCVKYGRYQRGKCFLPEEMTQNLYDGFAKQIKHCIELESRRKSRVQE